MTSSAALRINNIRRHFDSDNTVNKPTEVNAAGASSINVKVASEVSEALSLGRAVVALESTIISHGMPYPQNLQTAKEVEGIVKKNGAVPATIAILDGVPIVGLSGEELERLATLGPRAQKTARRDIAYVVSAFGITIDHIYLKKKKMTEDIHTTFSLYMDLIIAKIKLIK